jgi:hypothetical protein
MGTERGHFQLPDELIDQMYAKREARHLVRQFFEEHKDSLDLNRLIVAFGQRLAEWKTRFDKPNVRNALVEKATEFFKEKVDGLMDRILEDHGQPV